MTKAGLPKLKLAANSTTQSTKTSAAKTLSSTTRSAGISYGIKAQRTGHSIFNAKLGTSKRTAAVRDYLNSNRYVETNNYYNTPASQNYNSGLGAMGTLAMISEIGNMATEFGMGLYDLISGGIAGSKAAKTTTTTAAASGKTSTSTGNVGKNHISNMKNATDSTTLRQAIDSASAEQKSQEAELSTLSQELPSLKSASDAAETKLSQINPQLEAKKQEVTQKESEVSNQKGIVADAKKEQASALSVAKQMEAAVGEAATAYTQASQALVNAEATLASTPETIPDGNGGQKPNPAYEQAKQDVETAKANKEKAETALNQAKTENENAKANYQKAIKNYEEKSKALADAEESLKTMQGELEKLSKEKADLEKQKKDADGAVKKYQDALSKKEKLEQSINEIKTEIASQTTRLSQLEQQEETELGETSASMDKLAGKIQGRNEKIDTSDGMSFMEKIRSKRNVKNSNQYNDLTKKQEELQDRVNYTKLSKATGTTINGQVFRQATYNGKEYYMIDSKPVTKEEFEKAKTSQPES